jgi:hypothetical protein
MNKNIDRVIGNLIVDLSRPHRYATQGTPLSTIKRCVSAGQVFVSSDDIQTLENALNEIERLGKVIEAIGLSKIKRSRVRVIK